MWIVDNFLDTWDTNETSKYETYKFLKDTNCKARAVGKCTSSRSGES